MKFSEKIMMEEYLNKSDDINSYIKRIKNKTKKEYAIKYKEWKENGEKDSDPDYGNLSYMAAQSVRMTIDKMMNESIINEAPMKTKGWSQKSIAKFENTIGKKVDEHGFFDACVNRMRKHMGKNAEGFCASLKDSKYNSPMWRGAGKTKKEIEADVKNTQYPKSKRLPKYRKTKKNKDEKNK